MGLSVDKVRCAEIGKRLNDVRGQLEMSHIAFADFLGISTGSLHNYIKGNRDIPSSIWVKLLERFDIDIRWVLEGDNENGLSEQQTIVAQNTMLISKIVDERIRELGMTVRPEQRDKAVMYLLSELSKSSGGFSLEKENVDRFLRVVAS